MPILGIIASSFRSAGGGPQGAYDSLATITVPSGGLASIEFAGIPTGYKHLQVRATVLCTNQQNIYAQLNTDTSSNYSWHELFGQGSSAGAGASANASFMQIGFVESNATSFTGGFVADFLDYANTNKFKTMRSLMGSDANGSGYVLLRSGAWRNTNAVTSMKIYPASTDTFKQHSSFSLYGIR